jgi:hypothetical protein
MNPVAARAASQLGIEYRLPKSYFWLGLVCSAFFVGMGVFSAWIAWTNIDGSFRYPKETAVGFAVFWGLFTLLGVYLMRAYHVERLLVWEDRLRVVGSFRTRDVSFAEVSEARWRVFPAPGESLVLRTPAGKAVVYFGNYGSVHGPRLKEFFRNTLPLEVQTGWEKHDEMYTPTPAKLERARKARRWAHAILAVMGVGLIAVGVLDPFNDPAQRWTNLVFGVLSVAFVGYLLVVERRQASNTAVRSTDGIDAPDSPGTHP